MKIIKKLRAKNKKVFIKNPVLIGHSCIQSGGLAEGPRSSQRKE